MNTTHSGNTPQILLVEDDDDQAELVLRGLKSCHVGGQIRRVSDGQAALDYVFRQGPYANSSLSPRPDVILLDLRLPLVDGLDVLKAIKESPEARGIPVVMLSTSEEKLDISSAYERHANSYLVKPADFNRIKEMAQTLSVYWLNWNRNRYDEDCK